MSRDDGEQLKTARDQQLREDAAEILTVPQEMHVADTKAILAVVGALAGWVFCGAEPRDAAEILCPLQRSGS